MTTTTLVGVLVAVATACTYGLHDTAGIIICSTDTSKQESHSSHERSQMLAVQWLIKTPQQYSMINYACSTVRRDKVLFNKSQRSAARPATGLLRVIDGARQLLQACRAQGTGDSQVSLQQSFVLDHRNARGAC